MTSQNKKNLDTYTLEKKYEEKIKLQKQYGLQENQKVFVVWYSQDITSINFAEDLIKTIEWCLETWIQVVLLASAEKKFQWPMEKLQEKYKNKIAIIKNDEENEINIYKMSDVCIFLNNNDSKVKKCLSYWCVPLYLKSQNTNKIIKNFNPLSEEWNGFIIDKSNYWHIFANIVTSKETFSFPYDWENLQKQCIESSNK